MACTLLIFKNNLYFQTMFHANSFFSFSFKVVPEHLRIHVIIATTSSARFIVKMYTYFQSPRW